MNWECNNCDLGICKLAIIGSTPECCVIDGSNNCIWKKTS